MAEPIRLEPPNARRYTPAEREVVYLTWRNATGRSLRKTAERTGIALSTLAEWSKEGGWVQRAKQEDAEDTAAARASLLGRIVPGADGMLGVLEQIAHDEGAPAMARVKAAVEYCAMAGLVPPKESIAVVRPKGDGLPFDPAKLAALPPEERAEAIAALRRGETPDIIAS